MAEDKSNAEDAKSYRATKIMLVVVCLLFVWYLFADRMTPYTASARMQAFVIPVVPEVS